MRRYYKTIIFLVTLLLHLTSSSGQIQKGTEAAVRERFLNYCKEIPREEVYIQTDREEFIAGEDLWFNIFLINRQTNKLSGNSEIVYFELLNPDNMPIIRKRIKINNGSGPGQIILPDSISSGKYTLRAYTNWMKNFLPANCFIQKINVYNALSTKSFNEKAIMPASNNGMVDNKLNPIMSDSGLSVDVNNSESLEIIFNTTGDYRAANNNICYLFIQTHGILNYDNTINLQGDNTKIDLLKKLLIPGINQIVVLDSKGTLIAEKYLFTPDKSESDLKLNVQENSKTRSLIKADIEMDRAIVSSRLSVSVTPEAEYQYVQNMSDYMIFGSEFGLLPDELRNKNLNDISPTVINSFLATVRSNWIDWNLIVKGEIPEQKYKMEKGEHFIYGMLVNKTTRKPQPDEFLFMSTPGKNAVFQYAKTDTAGNFYFRIPISGKVKDIIIQPEIVDKNNTIKMESSFSEEYPGIMNLKDQSVRIIPAYISKWSVNYQVSKIFETSSMGDIYMQHEPVKVPLRFYGKPDIGLVMDDYIKLPVMDEVFFELLPGVFLKKKKSGYEMSILDPVDKRVYNSPPAMLIDGVIINDASLIAALDPETVERIDVVKEKYFVGDYLFYGLVNVITKAANFNSVLLPDYAIRMPYKAIEPVNVFLSPDFTQKENMNVRLPDFRNTLYWNPAVLTDDSGKADFEFWTSDIKTNYVMNIQGISSDGRLISYKKVIKVN